MVACVAAPVQALPPSWCSLVVAWPCCLPGRGVCPGAVVTGCPVVKRGGRLCLSRVFFAAAAARLVAVPLFLVLGLMVPVCPCQLTVASHRRTSPRIAAALVPVAAYCCSTCLSTEKRGRRFTVVLGARLCKRHASDVVAHAKGRLCSHNSLNMSVSFALCCFAPL